MKSYIKKEIQINDTNPSLCGEDCEGLTEFNDIRCKYFFNDDEYMQELRTEYDLQRCYVKRCQQCLESEIKG